MVGQLNGCLPFFFFFFLIPFSLKLIVACRLCYLCERRWWFQCIGCDHTAYMDLAVRCPLERPLNFITLTYSFLITWSLLSEIFQTLTAHWWGGGLGCLAWVWTLRSDLYPTNYIGNCINDLSRSHIISMSQCKTAVTPLLTHWSYCSLALSLRYEIHVNYIWTLCIFIYCDSNLYEVHEVSTFRCEICICSYELFMK